MITGIYAALAPCSIGYAEIGHNLGSDENTKRINNPFESWISLYSSEEFQQSVKQGTKHIDSLLADIDLNSARGQELVKVFKTATRMETAFWQQGLDINLNIS